MFSFALANAVEKNWGWILGLGILNIVLGGLAVAFVGVTTVMSVIYLGALLFIGGICETVYAFRARKEGGLWFHLMFGVMSGVCGFLIIMNPIPNMVLLTLLIASLFLVTGIVTLVGSVVERFDNWGWFALNGAVSIAAGYIIFAHPLESSIWLIGLWVGINLVMRGAAWVTLGLRGRALSHREDKFSSLAGLQT